MKKLMSKIKASNHLIVTTLLIGIITFFITLLLLTVLANFFLIEHYSYKFIVLEIIAVISIVISGISLLMHLVVGKLSRVNKILLVTAVFVIVISIFSNYLISFARINQPSGPTDREIGMEYSRLKEVNTSDVAEAQLVDWLNRQENVQNARIVNEGTLLESINYSLVRFGVSVSEHSIPVDILANLLPYEECVSLCPDTKDPNYQECLDGCIKLLDTKR